jgi:hypothetical protein
VDVKALLLALCALLPLLLAPAAAQAGEPFSVEPASGGLRTTFRFEAPARLLGPELLLNPGFAGDLAPWTAFSEVGAPAEVRVVDGAARLSVGVASEARTVYLRQEIAPTPGLLDFRVKARLAEGEVLRGVLLFRETGPGGEKDTVVPYSPGEAWQEVRATVSVSADARSLAVFLRYEMRVGQSGAVAFEAPSLRAAPRVTWDLAGEAAAGTVVEKRFDRQGSHTVTMSVDGTRAGSRVVRVENQPPEVAIASVRAPRGWTLDGRGTVDPDAPDYLVDGAFAAGAPAWTLDAPEVGGNATMEVLREDGRGLLRVRVGPSHPAGSVWAYQRVDAPVGVPLEFKVDVRDDADHSGYALVLRELGPSPRDTLVQAPASRAWQTLGATWTPQANATALYVQLRVLAGPDEAVTVDFADASLGPARQYLWRVDGRTVGREAVIPWPGVAEGPHEVRLQVTDAQGARAERAVTLDAPVLVEGSIVGPTLVRAGETARWSLSETRFPTLEMLENGGFEKGLRGWGFVAGEVGGAAQATAGPGLSGMAARLDYEARANGSFFLVQEVPIRNGTPYDLSLFRKDTGVDHYALILREVGFDQARARTPEPWTDRLVTLPSAPEWTPSVHRWEATHPDSTAVQVYLRAGAVEGDRGTVWFDNVSFAPARGSAWSVDGEQRGGGRTLTLAAVPPGDHLINVTLRSGGQTATLRLPIHALDANASLHPALEGGVRAAWSLAPGSPEGVLRLAREGNASDHPERVGEAIDPAPAAGGNATYALSFVSARGESLLLANGTFRPGAFAELVDLTPERPARGGEARVLVRGLDPRLDALEAVLDGVPVPLRPLGEGLWEGNWSVPLTTWGEAGVSFHGHAAGDLQGRASSAPVEVEPFRRDAPLLWVGLVAGAALVAWAPSVAQGVRRRWRRGG